MRWGKTVLASMVALLAVLAISSSASAMQFGVDWNGDLNDSLNEMEAVHRSGSTLYRLPIERWRWVAEGPATYDRIFGEAAEHGITILPYLYGRNSSIPGWPLPGEPEYGEWLAWAKELARRYGFSGSFWQEGSATWPKVPKYEPVSTWEVWNEPNLAQTNPPVPRASGQSAKKACEELGATYSQEIGNCPQAASYGSFLVAAANAIRTGQAEQQPGASTNVLFGGLMLPYGEPAVTFFEKAYAVAGVASSFNGLSIHPYSFRNEHGTISEFTNEVIDARNVLNAKAGANAKSLWITEVGWPIHTINSSLFPAVEPGQQASLLEGAFTWAKNEAVNMNIQSLIWYNQKDPAGIVEPTWDYTIGLRDREGAYRPSWWAFLNQTGAPAWPPSTPTFEEVMAGGVTEEGATLSAYVTPNGHPTSYQFEYGPTEAYGNVAPIPAGNVGSDWYRHAVTNQLQKLEPDSVYHFRISATSPAGTADSADQTFRTLGTMMSSRPAGRDAANDQWFFYPGANGQMCAWTWTNSGGWAPGCHTGITPAAGTVPAFLREPDNNQQLVYASQSGKVCIDEYSNAGGWVSGCPEGEAIAAGTSPTAARDTSNNLVVYYTGASQRICVKEYTNAGGWTHGCREEGEKVAAGTSPTVLRDPETNDQSIYYTGVNKRICALEWTNSGGWEHGCLEGLEVLPGTSPVAARDRANDHFVYFVGSNSQICGWNFAKVSGWAGGCREGQPVAAGTSPTFLRDSSNDQFIYYTGTNGHVCGWIFTNSAGWEGGCREGETVAAETSPTLLRSSHNTQAILYFAPGGKVCEQAWENATGWEWGCPGQSAAAGGSPAAAREAGVESVYYPGSDGRVCSWESAATPWGARCLGGARVGSGSVALATEGGNRWVFYRGATGRICGQVDNAALGTWEGGCQESGQAVAAGTTPSVFRNSSNEQWIYYAGTNGQVCRYAFANATGWTPSCLGGQTLAAASSPAAIREGTNQWVYYVGSNGRICGQVFTGATGTWEGGCQENGQAAVAGTTPSVVRNSSNEQWIYYAGTNGQVCRYAFANATGWTPSCLGGQARA